jgi:molybdenum cofactor biosynthesis enzyme
MISISSKVPTHRTATAVCTVLFSKPVTYTALSTATLRKGDALAVARVAGIMAAKKTADLIPLAHPGIGIAGVSVEVELFEGSKGSSSSHPVERAEAASSVAETKPDLSFVGISGAPPNSDANTPSPQSRFGGVTITATVECEGKTGVEMEALTAVSVAGLTVYDMCKGVDKGMVMQGVRVVKKTGGKSGGWVWDERSGDVRPMKEATTGEAAFAKAPEEASEEAELSRLMAMDAKEFAAEIYRMSMSARKTAAEVHRMTRWRIMVSEAKREQERAEAVGKEAQAASEEADRVRAHVAKCEAEVKSGQRGRVEQERLETARKKRRKWFESSAEGTVLVPETREWMMEPE